MYRIFRLVIVLLAILSWMAADGFVSIQTFDEIRSASVHCYGSSLQPSSTWKTQTCIVKNGCLDPSTGQIWLPKVRSVDNHSFEKETETMISPLFNRWNSKDLESLLVQMKPLSKSNGRDYRFRVYDGNELAIFYQMYLSHNVGHLFFDDYLNWFLMAVHAGMMFAVGENPESSYFQPSIVPIWINSRAKDPPWASCDWSRIHWGPGHNQKTDKQIRNCYQHNARWIRGMLGTVTRSQEANVIIESRTLNETFPGYMHCYPMFTVGSGLARNALGGFDAWTGPHESPPVTFGRSPLLFEWRKMMLKNLAGGADSTTTKKKRATRRVIRIFVSQESSQRVSTRFSLVRSELNSTFKELTRLAAVHGVDLEFSTGRLFELSAEEQVNLMIQHTCTVFISAAGGGAFNALFLRPGSSALLFGKDNLNEDWKIFQATSWLRVQYFDYAVAFTREKIRELVIPSIKHSMMNCIMFVED